MISVVQLGTLAYTEGLRLQQKLVELRKAGQVGDVLLLLEHTPVITLGRNAKEANVLVSAEHLAARGVEVFECDRGGDVTFHGPGQIVGYPIFDLRGLERSQVSVLSSQSSVFSSREPAGRKTLGVVDYVRRLEEVLIRTCGDFGIATKRVAGLTGVWTEQSQGECNREGRDRGPQHARFSRDGVEDFGRAESSSGGSAALAAEGPPEAKIAAIGVHISRSVTSHGFALNVNTDLSYFNLIVPCGITAKPVISMQKELGREVDLNDVAHALSRNFGTVFGCQMLWVETVDALLGNTVGVPMKTPAEIRQIHREEETNLA
jgi:lipoyl(octanoyl) transferase